MKPWLRLTLITLTVGGGFAGVVFTVQALQAGKLTGTWTVVSTLLYVFVLISGLVLVYRPQVTLPVILVLALQVPSFSVRGLHYEFYAGLSAVVTLSRTTGSALLHLGIQLSFDLHGYGPFTIGVNFVPVFLLVALFVGWVHKRQSAVSLSALGEEQVTEEQGHAAL